MADHPMQPIELDENGTARFKLNAIVRFMLDFGPFDLNQLSSRAFPRADYVQLMQLLGYSVSGFGDLSCAPEDVVAAADAEVKRLLKESAKHSPECGTKYRGCSPHCEFDRVVNGGGDG